MRSGLNKQAYRPALCLTIEWRLYCKLIAFKTTGRSVITVSPHEKAANLTLCAAVFSYYSDRQMSIKTKNDLL